jgi:hypothetical protein
MRDLLETGLLYWIFSIETGLLYWILIGFLQEWDNP